MASVSSIRFRKRPVPGNSPYGQLRLFLAEDGKLKTVDDAGAVAEMGGSASAGLTVTDGVTGTIYEIQVNNGVPSFVPLA